MKARLAASADLDFLAAGSELPRELLQRKVRWLEVMLAVNQGERVGWLELDFLWSQVPCISRLHLVRPESDSPAARSLLSFAQRFLWSRGYETLLSSSRIGPAADKVAWHRQQGFEPCGMIAGVGPHGRNETFFRKQLVANPPAAVRPRPEPFVESVLAELAAVRA